MIRVHIEVTGLGIVMCSHGAASKIPEGSDYLSTHYLAPKDIAARVAAGDIVGFGTGTPGSFIVNFHLRAPVDEDVSKYDFALRLWIDVRGGGFCVRDLYDLMDWQRACPVGQEVKLADGYYRLTVCSSPPASGVLGDNQIIDVFVEATESRPIIKYAGAPMLCP